MITGLWWIQTILTIAEIIGAYLFAGWISQEKISGYRKWILLVGMGMLTGLTIFQRTYAMYSRAWLLHSILSCIIIVMLCYKENRIFICVAYAIYFETLYCIDLFVYIGIAISFLSENFLGNQFQIGVGRIVVYFISRSVMAILLMLFYRNKGRAAFYFKSGGFLWAFILAAEHLGLILCDNVFIAGAEERAIDGWKILLLFYPFMLLMLAFYIMKQKYRMMYEQVKIQNTLYYNQYEVMEKQAREKDRVYHDFRNHLIMLQKLVSNGDVVRTQAYLRGLLKSEEEEIKRRTGHPVLDYLMQTKISDAQQKNILIEEEYECNLNQLDEEKLRDWGVLLGNLWDNAIEGCERAGENRKIIFSMKQAGSAIVIKIENSCCKDVNRERLRTTKADKKMHGIGLQNVEFVVNKYGGTIKQNCREGIFSSQIVMIL